SFYLYLARVLLPFYYYVSSTLDIYTLSLHDALPILEGSSEGGLSEKFSVAADILKNIEARKNLKSGKEPDPILFERLKALRKERSEEHTSELQSRENLVCRLLLENKKKKTN